MLCRHPILDFRVFVKAIKGSFTKNQYRTCTCHLWYNFIRGVYTIITTKANLDFYSMNKCKYLLSANRTQIAIMWLLQCTLNNIYIHIYIHICVLPLYTINVQEEGIYHSINIGMLQFRNNHNQSFLLMVVINR